MDVPATDRPAIRVQSLSKQYGAVRAVDGISFEVAHGAITALLGGNGAGKTTTLAMLLGLLLPSDGTVEVLGADMQKNRFAVLGRMNFSSPYMELPYRLTVGRNLLVYARLYGVADARARIRHLAGELELMELIDRRTGSLSAGQKTRVALAKALINEPEVLLLDEPTASLDPDTADWVRSYLENYCRRTGATVLMASHNMAEVERLCDQVLMMRTGRIVDRGTPKALVKRYGRRDLEEVFLDIARGRDGGVTADGARASADPAEAGDIEAEAP